MSRDKISLSISENFSLSIPGKTSKHLPIQENAILKRRIREMNLDIDRNLLSAISWRSMYEKDLRFKRRWISQQRKVEAELRRHLFECNSWAICMLVEKVFSDENPLDDDEINQATLYELGIALDHFDTFTSLRDIQQYDDAPSLPFTPSPVYVQDQEMELEEPQPMIIEEVKGNIDSVETLEEENLRLKKEFFIVKEKHARTRDDKLYWKGKWSAGMNDAFMYIGRLTRTEQELNRVLNVRAMHVRGSYEVRSVFEAFCELKMRMYDEFTKHGTQKLKQEIDKADLYQLGKIIERCTHFSSLSEIEEFDATYSPPESASDSSSLPSTRPSSPPF